MKRFGAAALVLMLVLSACSLGKKEPSVAVQEGYLKSLEVKKSSSAAIISGTIAAPTGETPSKVTFTADVTSSSDSSDVTKMKFDTTMKINVGIDDQKGAATIYLRSDGTDMFAKISDMQLPGEKGQQLVTQLSALTNKWWKVPADFTAQIKQQQTAQNQEQMMAKFKTLTPFSNVQEDGEEDVHGDTSTRYRVEVSKAALKEIILEAGRVGGNVLTPDMVTAIESALEDVQFSGAVSVNSDGIMNHVKGTVTVQPKDTSGSASFDFDISTWNHGDKVEIGAPEGAADFNPLMMFSIAGALGAMNTTETPATPDATVPGLPTDLPETPKVVVPVK